MPIYLAFHDLVSIDRFGQIHANFQKLKSMGIEDLTRIHSILLISTSGTMIASQYFDNRIPESSRNSFEDAIFQRASEDFYGEVVQHEDYIVVYRLIKDFLFFVVGDLKSNELLLNEVIETVSVALSLLFNGKVSAEMLYKQNQLVYLLIDETIEQGFIFEGDPEIAASRVMMKSNNVYAGKGIRSMNGF